MLTEGQFLIWNGVGAKELKEENLKIVTGIGFYGAI